MSSIEVFIIDTVNLGVCNRDNHIISLIHTSSRGTPELKLIYMIIVKQ